MINGERGKLAPIIELEEFRKYISKPFGSGVFKLRKSLHRHTFILDYFVSGDPHGSAELHVWEAPDSRNVYIVLFSTNISDSKEAFEMLFRDIQGKMMGNEMIPISDVLD